MMGDVTANDSRPVRRSVSGPEIQATSGSRSVDLDQISVSSLKRTDSNASKHSGASVRRTDSLSSKGSGTSDGELRDLQVVLRNRNRTPNGNSEDTCSEDSAERREQELIRRRSASVLEVKERANNRLREELLKAEKDLKLKNDECKKLARVQDQMGAELEDLTASLFEEANKMVQDANVKRMQSEKLLKEARAKVEVLQEEVVALKSLVITSTPSMPNKHLHPQIDDKKATKTSQPFVKGHRRSTSHHNFSMPSEISSTEIDFAPEIKPPIVDERELDPVCFAEFQHWRRSPTLDQTNPFLARIILEDISPCLTFTDSQLSLSVFKCVMDNTLMIEPVVGRNQFPRKCALTQIQRSCKHRIRLGDAEQHHFISLLARNRIIAVGDFITYLRYITQGLVKSENSDMYWEIIRLRKQMALAKLGLS